MVIARYQIDWQYLSKDHEEIAKKLSKILDHHVNEQLDHLAYAIIGTFGAGKTQLLYHIFKCAKNKQLLPLYFIAEDLFREVISSTDKVFTPGNIYTFIEEKVGNIKRALSENNVEIVRKILDPRGKLKNDVPELVNVLIKDFSRPDVNGTKVVLLIDELEGQYGVLQEKVQTRDRSPLREWLESINYVKFLAFAPAGIYELGGADRDRVKRIVLPPADIEYVRENLIKDIGKSNACWWLSRGKARQLFKACEVLKEKSNIIEADAASRIIKMELDSIGQAPTQVPAAETSRIDPSKIPFLLYLCPIKGETAKRYVIDINTLDTGELADKLIEAFDVRKDNAILISEYFRRTVKALSDDKGITYIEDRDLPEMFCLVFDHLLEYEHGSPELSATLGEILNLYERVKKEGAALYGIIGILWELKETIWQLPLTIGEIRKAFPFPTMNPIVKNYIPSEMKKKWEGKKLPVWKWTEGDISILFFASERDFMNYSEKDEFLSLTLPNGKGTLCLFPTGEMLKEKKPLFNWLEKNEKLKFIELPPLLSDFLLSAAGEIEGEVPGDLHLYLKSFKENKEDILLSRKSEIYSEAINEIIRSYFLRPNAYSKGTPPDAVDVWGKTKIRDRDPMVAGVALAFADLTSKQKQLLAEIMELFKGGREGKGIGDLRPLLPSGGLPTLADDLLPRYGRRRELKDSEPISRLKGYWRNHERGELVELARILSLEHFLKLHSDEDMRRLLEALWRTVRLEFDFKGIETLIQTFEKDVLPVLKECHKLERDGVSNFGLSGINFEAKENLVKAKDGFEKLLKVAQAAVVDEGSASPLVRYLVKIFMRALNVESDIRELESFLSSAKRALEELNAAGNNLRKNFWEYSKATKFLGMSEENIGELVSKQMKIGGTPTLQKLQNEATENKEYLERINTSLGQLNNKLDELYRVFDKMMEG